MMAITSNSCRPCSSDVDVTYSPASSMTQLNQERLATGLLIVYVVGKVFADNGDVGISFIAPPYGSQIGFSAQTVRSSAFHPIS